MHEPLVFPARSARPERPEPPVILRLLGALAGLATGVVPALVLLFMGAMAGYVDGGEPTAQQRHLQGQLGLLALAVLGVGIGLAITAWRHPTVGAVALTFLVMVASMAANGRLAGFTSLLFAPLLAFVICWVRRSVR